MLGTFTHGSIILPAQRRETENVQGSLCAYRALFETGKPDGFRKAVARSRHHPLIKEPGGSPEHAIC